MEAAVTRGGSARRRPGVVGRHRAVGEASLTKTLECVFPEEDCVNRSRADVLDAVIIC